MPHTVNCCPTISITLHYCQRLSLSNHCLYSPMFLLPKYPTTVITAFYCQQLSPTFYPLSIIIYYSTVDHFYQPMSSTFQNYLLLSTIVISNCCHNFHHRIVYDLICLSTRSMSTTVCHCLEFDKIRGLFNHINFALMIFFFFCTFMLSCHLQRIFLGSDQVSRRYWMVDGFCQYCSDKSIVCDHIGLFVLSTRENSHRMVQSLIWLSCPSEHRGMSVKCCE